LRLLFYLVNWVACFQLLLNCLFSLVWFFFYATGFVYWTTLSYLCSCLIFGLLTWLALTFVFLTCGWLLNTKLLIICTITFSIFVCIFLGTCILSCLGYKMTFLVDEDGVLIRTFHALHVKVLSCRVIISLANIYHYVLLLV